VSNRQHIVTDEELEKALDWLRDNAREMGDAKAETIRASHMMKVVKALEMKRHNEKPVSHQEREAFASATYLEALERDAVAAGEFETMRALREAASLKIEAWRSEQANFRALKI
jgi:RNA polymerase-interacting CarD/CdnL/TRCF family regulator